MKIRQNSFYHSIKKLSGNDPTSSLVTDIINTSADACWLRVTITPDLRLTKHASHIRGKCFFSYLNYDVFFAHSMLTRWSHALTRSLQVILTTATACLPTLQKCGNKLQIVLNAAARIFSKTNRYGPRITRILHDLHWRDVPERIKYKLCLAVFKCVHGMSPSYISKLCISVAQIEGRRQLSSAARGQLVVPRTKIMTYGKRAFTCAGQSPWNSFLD